MHAALLPQKTCPVGLWQSASRTQSTQAGSVPQYGALPVVWKQARSAFVGQAVWLWAQESCPAWQPPTPCARQVFFRRLPRQMLEQH